MLCCYIAIANQSISYIIIIYLTVCVFLYSYTKHNIHNNYYTLYNIYYTIIGGTNFNSIKLISFIS